MLQELVLRGVTGGYYLGQKALTTGIAGRTARGMAHTLGFDSCTGWLMEHNASLLSSS